MICNRRMLKCLLISISPGKCDDIENTTQLQRDSKIWEAQKKGVTTSSFHDAYTLQDMTSIKSLFKRLSMPRSLSHIPTVKWGIKNEDKAYLSTLCSSSHESFCCKPSRLIIKPLYPHVGAGPDETI